MTAQSGNEPSANHSCPPPAVIERLPAERALQIVWQDGLQTQLAWRPLRATCMCAGCVDEHTGQRLIEIGDIDPQIGIERLELVGNYALKIRWTDGHDAGLFTWGYLRQLSEPTSETR